MIRLPLHLPTLIKKQPKHKSKKILLLIGGIVLGIGFGLVLSVIIFNQQESKKDNQLEVTFVSPHQAIIFWKSDHPTLGYVKSGTNPNSLTTKTTQTSSVPGEVHAVVLDDIPLEGVYITTHTVSDSFFLWKEPMLISFDPSTLE